MRHRKHRHQLGVKKEHRVALMANLASALFRHGRIETTLAKAKALRPFSEKIITLAKKARATDVPEKRLHWYRLAISRVRDRVAVKQLFDERADEFMNREGGYVRIYKLLPRDGDAAPMAIIELISADDEGYTKPKRPQRNKASRKGSPTDAVVETTEAESAVAETAEADADAAEVESEATDVEGTAVESEKA